MKKDYDLFPKIMEILGSKRPFLVNGELSKSGSRAYRKLTEIIYSLESIGFDIKSNEIIDSLDRFIDEQY